MAVTKPKQINISFHIDLKTAFFRHSFIRQPVIKFDASKI